MNLMNITFRFLSIILLVGLFSFVSGEPATAQLGLNTGGAVDEAPKLDDPETKAGVRDMVSQLSDDAVRALLIERLDAVAEAKELEKANQQSAWSVISKGFTTLWGNVKWTAQNVGWLPGIFDSIFSAVGAALGAGETSKFWLLLGAALIAGLVGERAVAFFFRKKKQELIASVSTTLLGILKILYTRLSFDVLGVLAFTLVAYLVLASNYDYTTLPGKAGYMLIATLAAAFMAFVVSRFYFAPSRPDLRICQTSNNRAWRLTIAYSIFAGFCVFLHNFFPLFLSIGVENLGGWPRLGVLATTLNILLYVAASLAIWVNRHALTEILVNNKRRIYSAIGAEIAEDEVSWFARHWPKIAIILFVLKFLLVEIVINTTDVGTYSTAAVYITFIVIFLWPGIDANISLFVGKGIKRAEDETEAGAKARQMMQQGLLRVGRVFWVCVILYILAWFWGVNILGLAEAGLGAKVAGATVEVLLVVAVAYICWELVSIFVNRWLAAEGGLPEAGQDVGGGDAGGVGLSRTATLLPIIKLTAQVLIVVVSIVMVLNNLGVNIGPIIAGAGVLGLAIGFGAKTLVKDIVSGMFFLFDDAFRVGEYIDVGGTMGNVEKISLRSLRLRHHRGLVHTIPYGEIPKLTNFSRDWVIMKLRFRVPFDTDVAKVKKIFKKIGQDLLVDPLLGEDFLQPFKSQGVAEVDDNGLVVRGKFMAKPGKQFMIRKEVYVRVQKALEEAGIPFARKQVMVSIEGMDKDTELTEADLKAIGGAAMEASEEEAEAAKKK